MSTVTNVKRSIYSNVYAFLFSLSALCFIVSPAFAQKGEEAPVAIVNGVEIPYASYVRARLTRLLNMGADPDDTASLDPVEDDGIFVSLIDGELLLQEANKRGVGVSRDEAIDLLVNDPPEYILSMFAKGHYQPDRLRKLAQEPRTILQHASRPGVPKEQIVEEWKEDIDNLLRYYSIQESRRRLTNMLYDQNPLTEADIEHRYYAENSRLEGSVVRVYHSTVPDSLVPVTESEARSWFRQHEEEYIIPESRLPLTIILPMIPSAEDSAAVETKIEDVKESILSLPVAQRAKKVKEVTEGLLPNRIGEGRTISPAAFPRDIAQDLATARIGDLVGPYPTEGESLLLYVAGESPSADTIVHARHILMRPSSEGGENEVEGILNFLRELRDSIDSEEEFIASAKYYSIDEISGREGGDLGYAARGLYVPELDSALFAAPSGRAVGPIKSRYGYHLIWVSDKIARDLELHELRFPIHPSEEVQAETLADAESYAGALRSDRPTGELIEEIRQKYPGVVVDSMSYLKRLEPYADGLAVGEFLFRSDVGDVGVIPLPYDRVAVVKLISYWDGGAPQFEEIPQYPTAHVRRKKQLDILEERLADLPAKITPETLLGPIREYAPMAEVLVLKQQQIPVMEDEDPTMLDSLVAVTREGEVTGPVRGTHGLYFLRITEWLGPDKSMARREIPEFAEIYRKRYREQLLADVLDDARATAIIKDMRYSTLTLLGIGRP